MAISLLIAQYMSYVTFRFGTYHLEEQCVYCAVFSNSKAICSSKQMVDGLMHITPPREESQNCREKAGVTGAGNWKWDRLDLSGLSPNKPALADSQTPLHLSVQSSGSTFHQPILQLGQMFTTPLQENHEDECKAEVFSSLYSVHCLNVFP